MLALRLQRTGRKKVSNYRVIAQEHRFQPTSGKIVAYLGHYNPHTKEAELDTEQIEKYLSSGARPSDAAAKLFKTQGIKLPDWVTIHEYEDKKAKAAEEEKAAKKAKTEDAADEASDEADADSDDESGDDAEETTDETDGADNDESEDDEDKESDDSTEDESDDDNSDEDDDKKE